MDKNKNLYELLEFSAQHYPDLIAITSDKTELSYKCLNDKATEIYSHLDSFNITKGDRVAIYTQKSTAFIASIFGVLKSGAAYVPLDYTAPIKRNAYIISNVEAQALIIHKSLAQQFEAEFTTVVLLDDDLILMQNKQRCNKSNFNLAYILYTSGSTGKPKGVMHSNEAAFEFINWSTTTFKPSSKDCFLSHAPFHFDLSVFDLFVAIKHGARLVLANEETAKQPMLLAQLISEQNISIVYTTPTVLTLLATYGKMHKYNYEHLKLVLFAGEVFPVSQFAALKQLWDKPEYYNLYGPTETNVCTYYKIPDSVAELTAFPIGKCCEHYQATTLSTETGYSQLCISGKGILEGYWGATNNNTEAIYTDNNQKRWYKTGDLVEINSKDEYVYKGRIDRMVKVNGYRVELGEIEACLSKNTSISSCAVIPHNSLTGTTVLTAFVVCVSKENESIIRMKEFCIKHLPAYMVPNNFVFLSALPQTASNKISYQHLKELL